MLLEFGFKNYFSFKEGSVLSFKVNESCPEGISRGKDFVTVLGLKGANGSGKTNILRALAFVGHITSQSFSNKADEKLGVKPFLGSSEPSEFYAEFVIDGTFYRYDLHVDNERIIFESLDKKVKRITRVFDRRLNAVTTGKGLSELKQLKLRNNVSLIATAKQHEVEALDDVFNYFNSWFGNVNFGGIIPDGPNIFVIAKGLRANPDDLKFVKEFIADCDGGVVDIEIKEVTREDGEIVDVPFFVHESNAKKYRISHVTESTGTKSLFKYLMFYKAVISCGGLLILDEFDINLHPHILPKLLDLFDSPDHNPLGAQLVFSTHNTEILDWLGRYRCYLVNKENNESFSYRLDEIPGDLLRNDRLITPSYNRGDLGGIPRI